MRSNYDPILVQFYTDSDLPTIFKYKNKNYKITQQKEKNSEE